MAAQATSTHESSITEGVALVLEGYDSEKASEMVLERNGTSKPFNPYRKLPLAKHTKPIPVSIEQKERYDEWKHRKETLTKAINDRLIAVEQERLHTIRVAREKQETLRKKEREQRDELRRKEVMTPPTDTKQLQLEEQRRIKEIESEQRRIKEVEKEKNRRRRELEKLEKSKKELAQKTELERYGYTPEQKKELYTTAMQLLITNKKENEAERYRKQLSEILQKKDTLTPRELHSQIRSLLIQEEQKKVIVDNDRPRMVEKGTVMVKGEPIMNRMQRWIHTIIPYYQKNIMELDATLQQLLSTSIGTYHFSKHICDTAKIQLDQLLVGIVTNDPPLDQEHILSFIRPYSIALLEEEKRKRQGTKDIPKELASYNKPLMEMITRNRHVAERITQLIQRHPDRIATLVQKICPGLLRVAVTVATFNLDKKVDIEAIILHFLEPIITIYIEKVQREWITTQLHFYNNQVRELQEQDQFISTLRNEEDRTPHVEQFGTRYRRRLSRKQCRNKKHSRRNK